jgi:hypothetical protein
MGQEYSDKKRKKDDYALPDIEVFHIPDDYQPETEEGEEFPLGWYYWYCFPGCLPDSEPMGPYHTYNQALRAAQEEI